MVENLLVYMESSRIVQCIQYKSKGHKETNDAKLGSFDGNMGVVRHCIWLKIASFSEVVEIA
jgi:hypothetical protein